ncbi:MAG: S8 family serine peptidase, partial [Verrucomicrobiota bacterium]
GSHVAGTISAVGSNGVGVVGVSWSSRIMALKFLSDQGSGLTSDAIEAVQYATMMRRDYGINVRVTCNSWGGGGFSLGLRDAVDDAAAEGILFVAAAGNDGVDTDSSPHYPSSMNNAGLISVAATDRNDGRALFSNYGLTSVDLGAPGVAIFSTEPGNSYGLKNGTSMATPHVAGAAALLWSLVPEASWTEIRDAILSGVDLIPSMAGVTVTGGRLNLFQAMEQIGLHVISSAPARGALIMTQPTNIHVVFNEPYDPVSVQPADLSVNGIPSDSIVFTSSTGISFNYLSSPVTSQGLYTILMETGVVSNLAGDDDSARFSSPFRYDLTPLQVITTTPPDGAVIPLPFTSLRVDLNEDVDPITVDIGDLLLSEGLVTSVGIVDSNTLDYTLSGLDVETPVTITVRPGSLTDIHGNPNLPYTLNVNIDIDSTEFLRPLRPVRPLGSLVYEGDVEAFVSPPGDEDTYTLDLDGDQTIGFLLHPAPELRGRIALRDPSNILLGSAMGSGPGDPVLLPAVPVTQTGVYAIAVSGLDSTAGSYTLEAFLNTAIEAENYAGLLNDTAATAQDLDNVFIPLGPTGCLRGAVIGAIQSTSTTAVITEDFESGSLGPSWSTWSSRPEGRIRITGAETTAEGSYAMMMDRSPDGALTLNEAVWTVDLSETESPSLAFSHARFNDQTHVYFGSFMDRVNADAISISLDGILWRHIWRPAGPAQPSFEWHHYDIDIVEAAGLHGFDLGSNALIKIQQYDNQSLQNDGRGFDNLMIRTAEEVEDWYRMTFEANEVVDIMLVGEGRRFSLELYDPSENLIASGVEGDKNTKQQIQKANILSGGIHYLRVEAAGRKDYTVVITRNAHFDIGVHPTEGNPMNIQRAEAALGSISCEGSVLVGAIRQPFFPPEILEIDPANGNLIRRFQGPLMTNSTSDELSLAHDGTNLWIAGGHSSGLGIEVIKLNPNDGSVLFETTVPATLYRGMAYLNGEIFLAEYPTNIYVYDAETFTLNRTLTQPGFGFFRGIEGDLYRGVLWAVNDRYIYKLDPITGAVLAQSAFMPDGIFETGLSVGCEEVYVCERRPEYALAAYDVKTLSFIRRVPIPTTHPLLRGIAGVNRGPVADWYRTEAFVG